MDVPREYACGIADRLAPSELEIGVIQVERVSPEFGHRNLKGNPRARGRLFKDHGKTHTFEHIHILITPLFHPGSQIEDLIYLLVRQV